MNTRSYFSRVHLVHRTNSIDSNVDCAPKDLQKTCSRRPRAPPAGAPSTRARTSSAQRPRARRPPPRTRTRTQGRRRRRIEEPRRLPLLPPGAAAVGLCPSSSGPPPMPSGVGITTWLSALGSNDQFPFSSSRCERGRCPTVNTCNPSCLHQDRARVERRVQRATEPLRR